MKKTTDTARYIYRFRFFSSSGKTYTRTRRFDHKITEQEEREVCRNYELQLSLAHNESFPSYSCSYLGPDKKNTSYITNQNIKYPKNINDIIDDLIQYEYTDDEWAVAFDYQNVDGALIHFYGSIPELWKDWWDEAELCPSNDTMCWNIDILAKNKSIHWYISNDDVSFLEFTFESLITMLGHCLTLETIGAENIENHN